VFGILASIIAMWFSRQREFRADAAGAQLAGRHKMAAALERLMLNHGQTALPQQVQAFGISGGVARNPQAGLEWLRKAGEQNLVDAQLLLGRLYLSGVAEMGSDAAEAQQWLSRAAAQGSAQARKLLAQAEKIKNDEQAQYQAREQARKDWERWMQSTPSPYYWHWGHHGWQRY
jgi:TPR repeat protein